MCLPVQLGNPIAGRSADHGGVTFSVNSGLNMVRAYKYMVPAAAELVKVCHDGQDRRWACFEMDNGSTA